MANPTWDDTTEATPKWEDTHEPSETPGMGESLLRGVAQGATLGFAPKITGAGEALGDELTGNTKGKSLGDLYKQHRDESRANYDAAAAANPITSTVGNLAGGLIPAVATSGLAPAVEGAGLAANVGRGALAGTAFGAASGLGNSRADTLSGQLGDAYEGAKGGALVGGTLGAAGQALGALGDTKIGKIFNKEAEGTNLTDLSKNTKDLGDAAKETANTLENTRQAVSDNYTKIREQLASSDKTDDVKDLLTKYLKQAEGLQKNSNPGEAAYDTGESIKSFITNRLQGPEEPILANKYEPQKTETIPAQPTNETPPKVRGSWETSPEGQQKAQTLLAKLQSKAKLEGEDPSQFSIVNDPQQGFTHIVQNAKLTNAPEQEAATIVTPAKPGELYQVGKGRFGANTNMSPQDLIDLKNSTNSELNATGDTQGQNLYKQMIGDVNDKLDTSAPEYRDNDAKYAAVKNAQDALGVGPQDFVKNPGTGDYDLSPSSFSKLLNTIRQSGSDTSTAEPTAGYKLDQALANLKVADPEAASKLEPIIQQAGENYNLSRDVNSGSVFHHNMYGMVKGNALKGAAYAGKAANAVSDFGSWTADKIGQFANTVGVDGEGGQKVANVLREAANRDSIGRNALMFTLMQNPAYREIINKHSGM